MRRKSLLGCLSILFLPVIACFLYLFINGLIAREKVYYIPETGMYMKTIATPKDYIGYILFGSNNNLTLSDSTDFVVVGKNVSTLILLDSNKKDIYIPIYPLRDTLRSCVTEKNQIVYTISEVAITDTCFFKEIASDYHIVKKAYTRISISDNFDVVEIKNIGDSIYTVLKPLTP